MAPGNSLVKLTQQQYEAMINPKNAFSVFRAMSFKDARAALPGVDYKGQTFAKIGTTTHLRTVLTVNNLEAKDDLYDGSIAYSRSKFPYYFMHDEKGTYINGSGQCKGLVYQGPLELNLANGEGTTWWLEGSDVWKNDSIGVGDLLGVGRVCFLVLAAARCYSRSVVY